MDKQFTAVIPCLQPGMIERCLETLYRYTENIFYVIVIDMTKHGLDVNLRDSYPNLMVIRSPKSDRHHTGNLGFQLASNLGVRLASTPYVMLLNDDVEFIHPNWWWGVMATFDKVKQATPSRPPMLVNLASIKLPDWSVGRPKGDDFYILPYKEKYSDADWEHLINDEHYVNEHLTITPGSVIDGINLYASVIDTEKLIEVGLLDEYFFPGSAGDYDLSCLASMYGYRCVSTTLSWVFHHWSQTFQAAQDKDDVISLRLPELHKEDLRDKWGDRFDLWGITCTECKAILHTTDGRTAVCPKGHQSYSIPPNTYSPL